VFRVDFEVASEYHLDTLFYILWVIILWFDVTVCFCGKVSVGRKGIGSILPTWTTLPLWASLSCSKSRCSLDLLLVSFHLVDGKEEVFWQINRFYWIS